MTYAPRNVARRVRADEIRVGDLYVAKVGRGSGLRTFPVVSIDVRKTHSYGGAVITRYEIKAEGLLAVDCAPHSKHSIRRPIEG